MSNYPPHEYISVEKMKTGTYFEPEAYELFILSKNTGKIQIRNFFKDYDDQLTGGQNGFEYDKNFANFNIGNLTEDVMDCFDGDVDYTFDGRVYDNVEGVAYSLLDTSRVTDITTGIYSDTGTYDLIIQTNKRDNIRVAENLNASISHRLESTLLSIDEDEYIRGYQVIFKTPVTLTSFTSGCLTNSEIRPPLTYSLYLETDKKPLFFWKGGLLSHTNYDISFSELGLGKEETIKDIKILFDHPVLPVFKNIEKTILEGKVKNLENLATLYFGGAVERVVFPNMVFVSGIFEDQTVSNGDEWDSYTYLGELKKGKLPSTGFSLLELFSFISIVLGFGLTVKAFKKLKVRNRLK